MPCCTREAASSRSELVMVPLGLSCDTKLWVIPASNVAHQRIGPPATLLVADSVALPLAGLSRSSVG
jgi:hypothetical protein